MQEITFSSAGKVLVSNVTNGDMRGLLIRPTDESHPIGVALDIPGLRNGDTYSAEKDDVILWFENPNATRFIQEQLSIITLKQCGYDVIDEMPKSLPIKKTEQIDFKKFVHQSIVGKYKYKYYVVCEKCGRNISVQSRLDKSIPGMFGRIEGYEKLPVCKHCAVENKFIQAFGPNVIKKKLIEIDRYKCSTCGKMIRYNSGKLSDLYCRWNEKTETFMCRHCEIKHREMGSIQ